jgi:hypothetical protein
MPVTFEEYERLFDAAAGRKALGEASPEYANSPRAPGQIKKYIPGVRLIVSLRRPSDRVYSYYQMMKRGGRQYGDFATAFREEKNEGWIKSNFSYDSLSRYYELFDPSQIKPIKFDDLAARTQATLEEIFQFLDVDRSVRPDTSVVHNEGGDWRSPLLGRISAAFQGNRALMQRVKDAVPAGVWRLAREMVSKNKGKAATLTPELRQEVAEHFREDTLRLQDLVGLDLSAWLDG